MEAAGDSRREEFSRTHPTGCRHFSPNHLLFREAIASLPLSAPDQQPDNAAGNAAGLQADKKDLPQCAGPRPDAPWGIHLRPSGITA